MIDPLFEFTPEKWEAARRILSGEDKKRVSLAAASRAAGVSVKTLESWMRRAQERRSEDDPILAAVAEAADSCELMQGGRLEDVAWDRAINGVKKDVFYQGSKCGTERKVDNRLLERMLSVRDDRYRPKQQTDVNINISDTSEVYRRLLAGQRLALAEFEAKETIDLVPENRDDGSMAFAMNLEPEEL